MNHKRFHRPTNLYRFLLLGISLWLARPVSALLINPTSAPPGGLTARPLRVTDVTQSKSGSLILGAQSGSCNALVTSTCAKLCLNAATDDDLEHCITSWNDLSGAISKSQVRVYKDDPMAIDPISGLQNAITNVQQGFVHIKGTNVSSYPTTTRFSVPSGGLLTYAALVANGVDTDNYAGVFKGDVGIEPTSFSSTGLLCLNSTCGLGSSSGTCPAEILAGHYCISKWSDLSPPNPPNNLSLQLLSISPITEQGNVALSQAFSSGSLVVGDPEVMNPSITCGDGMCSALEASLSSCNIDCEQIPALKTFTTTPNIGNIDLNFNVGNVGVIPSISFPLLLVVRSIDKNFRFQPQNGVTYQVGGDENLAIVFADHCDTTCPLPDVSYGMAQSKTYYYRAWISNAYPRYSTFVTERTASSLPVLGTPPPAGLLFPVP